MNKLESMELRLIFHSIHNVMLAEELLLKDDIPIDMIPIPRELSSDCGMCLACQNKDLNKIIANLEKEPFTQSIMIYKVETPIDKIKTIDWHRTESTQNFQLIMTLP